MRRAISKAIAVPGSENDGPKYTNAVLTHGARGVQCECRIDQRYGFYELLIVIRAAPHRRSLELPAAPAGIQAGGSAPGGYEGCETHGSRLGNRALRGSS